MKNMTLVNQKDLATAMKIVMDETLATTLRNDKSHVRSMSEN